MDIEEQPGPPRKRIRTVRLDTVGLRVAVLNAMRASERNPAMEAGISANDGLEDLVGLVQAYGVAATRVTTSEPSSWFGRPEDTTPLHVLCGRGHSEYVELFVERGADVNAKDSEGRLPLHDASESGCVRCVRAVLGSGVVERASTLIPYGMLQIPAGRGDEDVVRVLMEAGAGVGECARDGGEALWRAVTAGHFGMVRLLMEGGVDSFLGVHGSRLAESAWLFGHHDIARWITEKPGPDTRPYFKAYPSV